MLGKKAHWVSICALAALIDPAWASLDWKRTEVALVTTLADTAGTAVYPFKNSGQSPVQIVEVQTSCGCTTASLKQRLFKPGESGEIRAVFDYGARRGAQRAEILVKTDEPKSNLYRLEIKANIPTLLTLDPPYLKWEAGEASSTKVVKIHVDPEGSKTRLMVGGENLYYTAVLKSENDHEYSLEITPKEPRKNISLKVPIETDHPNPGHKLYVVQVDIR